MITEEMKQLALAAKSQPGRQFDQIIWLGKQLKAKGLDKQLLGRERSVPINEAGASVWSQAAGESQTYCLGQWWRDHQCIGGVAANALFEAVNEELK